MWVKSVFKKLEYISRFSWNGLNLHEKTIFLSLIFFFLSSFHSNRRNHEKSFFFFIPYWFRFKYFLSSNHNFNSWFKPSCLICSLNKQKSEQKFSSKNVENWRKKKFKWKNLKLTFLLTTNIIITIILAYLKFYRWWLWEILVNESMEKKSYE